VLPTANGQGGSNFFIPEVLDEPFRIFRLRVMPPKLTIDDVDPFASKISYCIEQMLLRAPLDEWEFAVDLTEVQEMDRVFFVTLTSQLKDLREQNVQTYCYGLREDTPLFRLMLRNNLVDEFTKDVQGDQYLSAGH
jgi:hypothetical protein